MPWISIQTTSGVIEQELAALENASATAINRAFTLIGQDATDLFQQSIENWKHVPAFEMKASNEMLTISTPSDIYHWVNEGTPAHDITARRVKLLRFKVPSSPKTTPYSLQSGSGSRGDQWVSKRTVHHPGIAARRFDQVVAKRIMEHAAERLRDALIEAAIASGFKRM